jgi:uncharacterized OB-fold protein
MGRPVPVPDEASQPFFDAAARGTLLIKFCPACNRNLAPQAELCDSCFSSDVQWKEASGKGTVYSFVINHQVMHPGFASEVPYNVIVVELAEGPRLNGNYLGPNEDIKVDMPVQVTFEQVGDVSVPKWVKA